MTVKEIKEGMTAPEVAAVIKENFEELNNEKATKEEFTELGSEVGKMKTIIKGYYWNTSYPEKGEGYSYQIFNNDGASKLYITSDSTLIQSVHCKIDGEWKIIYGKNVNGLFLYLIKGASQYVVTVKTEDNDVIESIFLWTNLTYCNYILENFHEFNSRSSVYVNKLNIVTGSYWNTHYPEILEGYSYITLLGLNNTILYFSKTVFSVYSMKDGVGTKIEKENEGYSIPKDSDYVAITFRGDNYNCIMHTNANAEREVINTIKNNVNSKLFSYLTEHEAYYGQYWNNNSYGLGENYSYFVINTNGYLGKILFSNKIYNVYGRQGTTYKHLLYNAGYESGYVVILDELFDDIRVTFNNGSDANTYNSMYFIKDNASVPFKISTINYNHGRKILWIGTSITEGCQYPQMSCLRNNYIPINNGIGASGIVKTTNVPSTAELIGRVGKDLSETVEEKIERYGNVGFSEEQIETIKSYSWENLIKPYIDGTIESCDIIIFEHGYNDASVIETQIRNGIENIDWDSNDRATFTGAFKYLYDNITAINPYIRFIIGGYFQNTFKSGENICKMQMLIAEHYNLEIWPIWAKTSMGGIYVPNSSDFISKYNTNYGTSYDPIDADINGNITRFQLHCPDGTHPYTDKSGNSNKILNDIYTSFVKSI